MKKNYEIIKKIQITIIPLHFIFQSEFHNLEEPNSTWNLQASRTARILYNLKEKITYKHLKCL